ncbi:hypothetical protein DERP_011732 [Dermatophagoides pteronyssinus]|uniref:Uncharacterized protein n=1 Tax=Dermatophagoides pteronyssinus TaxID=6956 RepID=A0ABQ8J3B4_DERPT|nr:hypothetical protein DERP_011732 [Dermatophagoides pteronyssinus]
MSKDERKSGRGAHQQSNVQNIESNDDGGKIKKEKHEAWQLIVINQQQQRKQHNLTKLINFN